MLSRLAFFASFSLTAWSGASHAQLASAPSPLPRFDTESGAPSVIESIINQDTLVDIGTVRDSRYYDMARSVARVEDPAGEGFCTGFRVAEDLFLTNYHCWEESECELQFHLGYETNLPEDQQAVYKCAEVVEKLERLDYALYRVVAAETNPDGLEFPIARLSKKPLTVGMPLLVPGHPSAEMKKIDISDECKLTRAEPYDYYDRDNIQHQCDTIGGSSGSPVLDRDSGDVIGLHWGATGGTESNHAIPMYLILGSIEALQPASYAKLTVVQ